MNHPDCLSCRWLVKHKDGRQGGACHGVPPTPAVVGMDRHGQPLTLCFWPVVGKGDWCAQHQVQPELDLDLSALPRANPQ